MKRISDDTFKKSNFNYDNIVALRIENGNFYFLGWMEDTDHYAIRMLNDYHQGELERDHVLNDTLYKAITSCEGYAHNIYYAWIMDDDRKPIMPLEQEYENAYARFLSFVNDYERNGVSDQEDHDIFCLSQIEFQQIVDALRDGDYVFVLEEE